MKFVKEIINKTIDKCHNRRNLIFQNINSSIFKEFNKLQKPRLDLQQVFSFVTIWIILTRANIENIYLIISSVPNISQLKITHRIIQQHTSFKNIRFHLYYFRNFTISNGQLIQMKTKHPNNYTLLNNEKYSWKS